MKERETVELSIPVGADLLVLARFAAATIASRAGFDLEEIDDLRLAVDELCVSLIEEGDEGRLTIELRRADDLVEISCRFRSSSGEPQGTPRIDPSEGLSDRILDALVDEHGKSEDDHHEQAWLRKRRVRQ
jgi:anti-sigma regulatory factor (Ser/Thr protein kinase)